MQAQACDYNAFISADGGSGGVLWKAVRAYTNNGYGDLTKAAVEESYGPIEEWCVGEVTDFNNLFGGEGGVPTFNSDITGWNTGKVSSLVVILYFTFLLLPKV